MAPIYDGVARALAPMFPDVTVAKSAYPSTFGPSSFLPKFAYDQFNSFAFTQWT
eukprot:SAG31_NODE_3945_length_3729_cov_4.246832_3_plen_54_part_00